MIPILLSVFLLSLLWAAVLYLKVPAGVAIITTLALLAAWACSFAWRRFKAHKAAGRIEKALSAQADAQAAGTRPDQQADVAAMQAEFAKAVQALKRSKLARGGRDALALLPWYMIIGPPGGGKSTALRASGLKFPYLSERGGVRGVGGTRNCEWWLSNEAVLLDTAGRYTTEDEDHAEWMEFLDMLARARPKKPLNGLIVAISLLDVAAEDEEAAAELGRRIRQRVDEVMARLKMVLPVYVMLTKCDLLPGFVETFGDLPKGERGQVWGFTVPPGPSIDKAEIEARIDELLAVIEERSLWHLGEERQLARRERIYEFPQQLGAGKPMLASFLEALFAESAYQDTPILRGVYLTSGRHEGRVVDRVMTRMAEAFGVRSVLPQGEPVLEARSYFLRDVFARVIIPDQGIAFRNARAVQRDDLRRWALVGGAGLVTAVSLLVSLRSFLWNRELIQSTGEVVAAVSGKLGTSGHGSPPVAELEPLRERLSLLLRLEEEGPPFAMGLGMYHGGELFLPVRGIYAAAVRRLLLDPISSQDVADIASFVQRLEATEAVPAYTEYARFYDALKLHLLLTAPRSRSEPRIGKDEQVWIGEQIAKRWASRWSAANDPTVPGRIGTDARLFAKLLASDSSLALPRYEDLVRRERRVLARLPLSALAVDKLAAEVEGKGYDLTLAAMLGAPVAALRASNVVRGAYTRRAYEEVVKKLLDDPASLVELWVIAGDDANGQPSAVELDRLRSRYYQRYIEEWERFLDSVTVQRGQIRALPLLQDLTSGEPPPLALLFRAVAYNTRVGGTAGTLATAGRGILERIQSKLDPGGKATEAVERVSRERAEALVGAGDVERRFAGFLAFGDRHEAAGAAPVADPSAPHRTSPLDVYQEQLSFVRDALQASSEGGDPKELVGRVAQARTRIQSLIDDQDLRWRPRLASLLWPAVNAATETTIIAASSTAAQRWCSEVASPFERQMASHYPFVPAGDDVALVDVAEFFRPTSGRLWAFYNEALRNSVARSGDEYVFTPQLGGTGFRPGLLPFLKRAQEITAALFPPGSAEPSMSFSVKVRPTPGIAAVSLDVDGARVEYRNGPEEWRRLSWPGKDGRPGASLRVRSADGREETLRRDGDWALFRLLEAGAIQGDPRPSGFSVAFPMPGLGTKITVDFQTARSETPFFGVRQGGRSRWLGPFRSGVRAPREIGRGAGYCRS